MSENIKRIKLAVSSDWTPEERWQVAEAIRVDISHLEFEEAEWRKTIIWGAPCYAESRVKRESLQQMLDFLEHAPGHFLEDNRFNFKEYVK